MTSFASVILPSFKQIANKLSRLDKICETKPFLDELDGLTDDVPLENQPHIDES